jgi:hypothetical protein
MNVSSYEDECAGKHQDKRSNGNMNRISFVEEPRGERGQNEKDRAEIHRDYGPIERHDPATDPGQANRHKN